VPKKKLLWFAGNIFWSHFLFFAIILFYLLLIGLGEALERDEPRGQTTALGWAGEKRGR